MRARTFNIMQYERHPETGEPLINEDIIKVALSHKTITKYAYICHDKDVYSLKDEANDTSGKRKAGDKKPRHWHIVCNCENAVEVSTIAKWFGISENFVDVPKGAGAFLDCVQYLTHEDERQAELGKQKYNDDEVKASFDFRTELNVREEKRLKYGKDTNLKDAIRYEVLYNGMTLRQAEAKDHWNYMGDMEKLKKFRLEYLQNAKPPRTRINFYVEGRGGVGKGLACRVLARNLFPDLVDDKDIFFETGAKGAAFEGFDGQPVIIWNDRRAIDFLQELSGRGNVFDVLDSHPTTARQNIKYGSINLVNEVNIINGVENFEDFLDGLAGEYTDRNGNRCISEDKGQSYRRMPFIIRIHEQDFDLLMNKGFVENTANFYEYVEYDHIRGNMQQIAIACGNNEPLRREIEQKTIKPVVDKYNQVKQQFDVDVVDEEAVRTQFADYGTGGVERFRAERCPTKEQFEAESKRLKERFEKTHEQEDSDKYHAYRNKWRDRFI